MLLAASATTFTATRVSERRWCLSLVTELLSASPLSSAPLGRTNGGHLGGWHEKQDPLGARHPFVLLSGSGDVVAEEIAIPRDQIADGKITLRVPEGR